MAEGGSSHADGSYTFIWSKSLYFKEYGSNSTSSDNSAMSISRDDGYPVDVRTINSPLYKDYYKDYDFIGHYKGSFGSATYGGGTQLISGHLKGYGRVDYAAQFIGPSTPGAGFEKGMLTGNFNAKNTSDFSPSTLAGYGGSISYGAGFATTGTWYSFSSYSDIINFNKSKATISGELNAWSLSISLTKFSYSKSYSMTTLIKPAEPAPATNDNQ